MKVLVGAFEPFGGRKVNASLELARRLPGRVGPHEVRAVKLPVVYGGSWPVLERAVLEFRPRVVLALGEAPGRDFRLERVAVNLRSGAADNAGRAAEGEPLDPAGRAAYLSTLPVTRLLAALKRAGVPARTSLSAGAYLCNETFYCLMRADAARRFPGGAGFLHVPRDAHKRWPDALKIALRALN